MVQNYLLIWLNDKTDISNNDSEIVLSQLRNICNDVHSFTNVDTCIDFLTEIDDHKAFMIISEVLCQQLVPNIHEISQLEAIFIYSSQQLQDEQWIRKWSKINGVHTSITTICRDLKQVMKRYDQDSIPMSFVATTDGMSDDDLNRLEPSFMYTQIFKEIFLNMNHSQLSICNFTTYCHGRNDISANNIKKFQEEYSSDLAIWWYTYPCFIFSMLNDALRTLESDTVIKMGFFIHDLHYQIKKLYEQQYHQHNRDVFVVYRGQGLSNQDFEKLQTTKGGLISFNNFLSTSEKREISLVFATCSLLKSNSIGILFRITIDPSISSTPFAVIDDVSYFKDEREVLFSMHSVFRIGDIKKIDGDSHLYEVDLKLTADDDQQLGKVTEQIRKEISPDSVGWYRIGQLLIKLGHFAQLEKIYSDVLHDTTDDGERAIAYYHLGWVKYAHSMFEEAILFYQKALEIFEKILPPNHIFLHNINNNIGAVYVDTGEYSKALVFLEKALEMKKKLLPANDQFLAHAYNNIGMVYDNIGEYSKALSFYEKALEIKEITLPVNHPSFATLYNNIGMAYEKIDESLKALLFHKKALHIRERTLPCDHPDFAQSYTNIGVTYIKIKEYSEALLVLTKAVEIRQKILPPDHHLLGLSYHNLGTVTYEIGDYSKALSLFEKAVQIYEKTLSRNHPLKATTYNNIGDVLLQMKNHAEALSYYQRALDIRQRSLRPNHPDLQDVLLKVTLMKTLL